MIIQNDVLTGYANELTPTKKLPIVLCLDVSPSMSQYHRIENLNIAVQQLYERLNSCPKRDVIEVAVITYSTNIIEETDFLPVSSLAGRKFVPAPGGTYTSMAVTHAIDKLTRRCDLLKKQAPTYLPFLILVTDGNPDDSENPDEVQASINLVLSHCKASPDGEANLIAPYIIGVGSQVRRESLDRYAANFTREAIIINDDNHSSQTFTELFTFIGNSIRNSLNGTSDLGSLYHQLSNQMQRHIAKNRANFAPSAPHIMH